MLIEIFDTEFFKGRRLAASKGSWKHKPAQENELTLSDLAAIFEKMRIPAPEEDIDISNTSEGGYNLMLNRYGAVLRIYPNSKTSDEMGERTAHLYSPDVLPAIGLVQFDGFSVELVPGKKHADSLGLYGGVTDLETFMLWAGRRKVARRIKDETGYWESPKAANFAKDKNGLKNLDVVGTHNVNAYEQYAKKSWLKVLFGQKSTLDRLIKENNPYQNLQQSFYQAWIGEKFFDDFWAEMTVAKESGLLEDGWNNSRIIQEVGNFGGKGFIAELAARYEQKLSSYLNAPPSDGHEYTHDLTNNQDISF